MGFFLPPTMVTLTEMPSRRRHRAVKLSPHPRGNNTAWNPEIPNATRAYPSRKCNDSCACTDPSSVYAIARRKKRARPSRSIRWNGSSTDGSPTLIRGKCLYLNVCISSLCEAYWIITYIITSIHCFCNVTGSKERRKDGTSPGLVTKKRCSTGQIWERKTKMI